MKTTLLKIAFALAGALSIAGADLNAQVPSAKIVPPAPKPFVLPAYEKTVMPNGLTVLLLEKHDVPLISMNLVLRSGSVADPAGKEGLAAVTARLLRRGTTSKSADEISSALDYIGMNFAGGASLDSSSVSADFLKKDQDTALPLATEILLHPSFPADEVAKTLARAQDQAKATKDNPQAALTQYYYKFLFGSHPYGRPVSGDESSLKAITREDVEAFYKANYVPGNAILALVGDFDSKSMKIALAKNFGAWSGKAPVRVPVPKLPVEKGRRLLLVDKPDATQTYFSMGNIGIDATNADRGVISVVNELYGGRFTSLFNTELRIKSGYSYGASSGFSQLHAPGPFTMLTYTKNATTGPAIDKSLEVVNTAHAQGFTDAQLTSAKNSIAGSLPLQLQTAQAVAATMTRNELYGITRDQFNANLVSEQNASVAEEKRVLNIYYPTADNLVIVVVGKASEIKPLMSKYTTSVTEKKTSDPGY